MEYYINNVNDITFMSELTLDIKDVKGKFAHITYSHSRVRKLCAHLNRGVR